MLELHQSWLSAWRGISSTTDGEDTYAAVIARYREPHRRYHTLQHLGECLGLFKIARSLSFCAAEVEVALWFHDAIYDVKRSDNEEQSAEWAKTAIVRSGASVEAATLVHSLVMVTKHTRMPRGPEEQLLVDIDLSVLGSNKERFAEYERQIREEYATFRTCSSSEGAAKSWLRFWIGHASTVRRTSMKPWKPRPERTCALQSAKMRPNHSIAPTVSGGLCPPATAAHIKRQAPHKQL